MHPFTPAHSLWRMQMLQFIAEKTDFAFWGIMEIYVIGSVKQHTAGPGSDIDIIVIHQTNKLNELQSYFDAWGHCLAAWNASKTGVVANYSLLDVHFLHISQKNDTENSFASMLSSINNSAKLIKAAQ